tara:strand:- start:31330 stop:32544 length:1215 start_codon:yes stop_codon:yes gene_type:complete
MTKKNIYAGLVLGVSVLAASASMAGSVSAQEAIKICSVDDRSGAAADTGNESFRGLEIAIEEANAAGGIGGHLIEIIEYDGKTDPQLTASFAARCAEDDGALLILGGNPAAPAAAITPIANEYGVPYFMMSAGTDNLTDNPAPYLFRFGPRNAQDAIAYSQMLEEQGFKRVALVFNTLPFGLDSAAAARQYLGEHGIEIVAEEGYDVAATDLSPQIVNIKAANPEAVLVFPYPADGARVLRTLDQLDVDVPVLVTRSALLKTLREIAGAASNGILIPNTVDTQRADVQAFFAKYEETFGETTQPTLYPVIGYDGARAAFEVIARPEVLAAIESGDLAAARTAFRDGVIAIGDFTGLQGKEGAHYHFADDQRHGSPDENWFTFITVENDGADLVLPDMNAFQPAS